MTLRKFACGGDEDAANIGAAIPPVFWRIGGNS
jgi:hypothetical protein